MKTYCEKGKEAWCRDKVNDMKEFRKDHHRTDVKQLTDVELALKIVEIHNYLYDEYKTFSELWIQFNPRRILFSLTLIFILLLEVGINFLSRNFA